MSTVIDNIVSDVKDALAIIEPALAVIAVAQAATGIGGVTAERAVSVIRAALKSFEDAATGAATRERALAGLAALQAALASSDAAADAALEARFPGQ